MEWLKQSTAVTVKMGPFVDDSDGKTAETGLTISQADIRVSKNGGAFAQTNNAAGATHDENGYYGVPLDTTDTGTLGRLRVTVSESGALPVVQDFMVLPANVYDSLVAGSDKLQADAVEISSDSAAADALELLVENAKGTDHKVLLSTDAQDLNSSLHVDAKAVAGSTTVANNMLIVFATDFATNYDATNDRWQVDTVAVGGSAVQQTAGHVHAYDDSGAAIAPASTALTNATWTDARAGYVDNLNGHTAQTGDVYAALPTNFSDLSITVTTGLVDVNGKTGFKLASDGLDSVATTAPTGVASDFREMLVQLWRRFFKKSTLTASELKTFADNGTDVLTTQSVTDDDTTQTQGAAS